MTPKRRVCIKTREREAAGPSGIGNRGRLSVPAETTEYTNALEIIDMLYVGFNGASLTGLSQDDMELSSKSKWLVCPEEFSMLYTHPQQGGGWGGYNSRQFSFPDANKYFSSSFHTILLSV